MRACRAKEAIGRDTKMLLLPRKRDAATEITVHHATRDGVDDDPVDPLNGQAEPAA
jgi:hypothetical protein